MNPLMKSMIKTISKPFFLSIIGLLLIGVLMPGCATMISDEKTTPSSTAVDTTTIYSADSSDASEKDSSHPERVRELLLTFEADIGIIEFGESVRLKIKSKNEQIVSFSDQTQKSSFYPPQIRLHPGNAYTAEVLYTPAAAGEMRIQAFIDHTLCAETSIIVSPYAIVIGFIGDSITFGAGSENGENAVKKVADFLGESVICLNAGISNTDAQDWGDDDFTGSGVPTNTELLKPWTRSTDIFDGRVDIVSIMLGANDAEKKANPNTQAPYTVEEYQNHLQRIVDRCKESGIRQVILHYNIYFGASSNRPSESQKRNIEYQTAIDRLVTANCGYVLLGNTDAYAWFRDHPDSLPDKVHPNNTGYAALGEFWADAIRENILYQAKPNHVWVNATNMYTKKSDKSLLHAIDKYIGEYTGMVFVDDIPVAMDAYTAPNGSTVVELNKDYLRTLTNGTHVIRFLFSGGVQITDIFLVQAF